MMRQWTLKSWELERTPNKTYTADLVQEFCICIGWGLGWGWYDFLYDGLPLKGFELGVIAFRLSEYVEQHPKEPCRKHYSGTWKFPIPKNEYPCTCDPKEGE